MFYGYGEQVWQGTLVTIELAVLSVLVAIFLGLLSACGKLFGNRLLQGFAQVYTSIIRGVPDLVLMLLIFYSLQIWLNQLTDFIGLSTIEIDPFSAGILTIGFIYGAYFAETFRGAFLMVPSGQLEAGYAYGMSRWQVFRLILFPQMMRHALPGVANNWLVTLKSTALVSLIGLSDVVKVTQDAGKGTYKLFFFTLLAGAIYLLLTSLSNGVLWWLERRYQFELKKPSI
ncbi:ABC transporter permease [Celerinatantimonas yamalensis]|uniref:Histidine ABC transporter permease HisQ n=1 Tax=Celerinatantimonas yamalensis TaxID=559956 RepID=A0ABW9G993_9GAMM